VGDTRHKDAEWTVEVNSDGRTSWEAAQLAVLMDIRDELKRVNFTLRCQETQRIPQTLKDIRRLLAKRRKR
jgi:hypothetical protein